MLTVGTHYRAKWRYMINLKRKTEKGYILKPPHVFYHFVVTIHYFMSYIMPSFFPYFYFMLAFASMYAYLPSVCLVPTEVRRHHTPWKWSHGSLCDTMLALGWNPDPLQEEKVLNFWVMVPVTLVTSFDVSMFSDSGQNTWDMQLTKSRVCF